MTIVELKEQIRNNELEPFYIFTGEEWKIQEIYLEQISKTTQKTIKRIDSIADVYSSLRNGSLLRKSYIYVVRDDKELMTNEKLQAQLSDLLKSDMLILMLTTLDKRLKFYKTYKDSIVEFELLNPLILRRYIQKEIALSDKNADKLIEVCESNYGRCLLEIDKINVYAGDAEIHGYDMSSNEAFEALLLDGTITTPPKDAIFDFVDAILDGKVTASYALYQECLDCGEAVMVMLTVLYNNAKAVLQVQSCESDDIEKSTGLTSWQINNAKKHCNRFSNRELINIMQLCYECQKRIVTGTMEEEFAVPYILTNTL